MKKKLMENYLPLVKEFEDLNNHTKVSSTMEVFIGYGRNLTREGISDEEAEYLLQNDIQKCLEKTHELNYFDDLSINRKMVIIDIILSMGFEYLCSLKKFNKTVKLKKYKQSAQKLLDTEWHEQKGERAKFFTKKMLYG